MTLDSFYCSPPTFDSLSDRLKEIAKESELFQLSSAGKSVLERPLWVLSAGEASAPPVLLVGCTHGSEWISLCLPRPLPVPPKNGRKSLVSAWSRESSSMVVPC